MINPKWRVIDIDPCTWRALGPFFDPSQYVRAAQPGEHGLFVLHKDGKLLRIVDNQVGVRKDLGIEAVEDPHLLASQLYQTNEWQRVHVISERHLAAVAAQAQANPRRDLHLDEYYHLVYRLIWENPNGYVCVPPKPDHWNGWRYGMIKSFVEDLPDPCTLALGVLDRGRVQIGLIVEFQKGSIDLVTTFDTLDLPIRDLQVDPRLMLTVWEQIGRQFAAPAVVLLCTPAVFMAWLIANDKRRVIQQAEEAGTAVLKNIVGS